MSVTAPAGLPTSSGIKFDIENRASDVDRIGQGVTALARLMSAADPGQTDGYHDVPILHGLSHLLEVAGAQLRTHAEGLTDSAIALYREGAHALEEAQHSALVASTAEWVRKQA